MDSHVQHLLDSYHRYYGDQLIARGDDESERLMRAPFVVLSHDTQVDPVFNYGNQMAQQLFEMNWETLTQLPSRFSTEPQNREARAQFLEEVAKQGYSNQYRGIRISSTGRRFFIENVKVWSLHNAANQPYGQAATFAEWTYL